MAEQRYKAVLAVIANGRTVSEVAKDWGVSRQTMHAWLARYEAEGLEGLNNRSHRPAHSPKQMPAVWEAKVLEVRRARPYWGARRLALEPISVMEASHLTNSLDADAYLMKAEAEIKRETFRWEEQHSEHMADWDLRRLIFINGSRFDLANLKKPSRKSGVAPRSDLNPVSALRSRLTVRPDELAFILGRDLRGKRGRLCHC